MSNIWGMSPDQSLKGEEGKIHSFLHPKRQLSVKISTFLNVLISLIFVDSHINVFPATEIVIPENKHESMWS